MRTAFALVISHVIVVIVVGDERWWGEMGRKTGK